MSPSNDMLVSSESPDPAQVYHQLWRPVFSHYLPLVTSQVKLKQGRFIVIWILFISSHKRNRKTVTLSNQVV